VDIEAARAIVDANSYMTLATAMPKVHPGRRRFGFAHEQFEAFLCAVQLAR